MSSQLDTLAGLADVFLVRDLGADAISAVGVSQIVTMVVGVVMISISTGAFTMVAQAIGAGSPVEASSTTKQAFTLVTLVSIALSLIGIITSRFALEMLSMPPAIIELGTAYLRVFFAGLVFMTLNFTLSNCLYGAGETRIPLYLNGVMALLKIALSYLLIFGIDPFPELGVTGAALSTVISRAAGFLLGMVLLYSGRLPLCLLPGTSYFPDGVRARRMLRIGIPSAMQGLFRNGSGVVFLKLIALTAAPVTAVAAYSIGNQMERIIRRTSLAFGTAATTLVGQNLGAQDQQAAVQSGWTATLVGALSMALLGLPLAWYAPEIMGFFTVEPAIIRVGVIYIYAISLAEPFQCLAIGAGGALRGAGETKPALYYTIISQWLVRLPAGYALAFWLHWDISGLWVSLFAFSVLQALLTIRKFNDVPWQNREF